MLPGAVVLGGAVLLAALWSARPASPRPADCAPTEFSEARARPIVDELAGAIGERVAGSAGATRALAYLEKELRAIPGLEVEVQNVTATAPGLYTGSSVYTVRNLVARLPGDDEAAVLLAAHYDAAPGSRGAADDGVAVAAVVETARCLAAGPRLPHSVIFLLDEGEELGLFGAHGFLHHPLARDVRVFVNLEAAGARGRPILFQTGPGDAWLARAYARGAPHPHGTVLGQDVFASGVIPSDTDFRVYRDVAGLTGLDVALYRDGWAYHTPLDGPERLEPGSLQEMGANALGVVRDLASHELAARSSEASAVYYDVLGLFLVTYPAWAAPLFAAAWLIVLAGQLVRVVRARRVGAADLLRGALEVAGALVVAASCAALVALLVARGAGAPHGWYARPWLAALTFGATSLVAVSVSLRYVTRDARSGARPDRDEAAAAATRLVGGAGLVFAAALVGTTLAGLGSAYLCLWWTAGAAVTVRCVHRPRVALLLGWTFPALLTAQAGDALLANFAAVAGRLPLTCDALIALLVAVPVALAALLPCALLVAHPPRRPRLVAAGLVVAVLAGAIALASVAPYTAERPKRVLARILGGADGDVVSQLGALDGLPLTDRRARVEDPLAGVETLALPADAIFGIVGTAEPAAAGPGAARRVHARLEPRGATIVSLILPREVVRVVVGDEVAWPRADAPAGPADHVLSFVAPPAAGLDVFVDVAVDAPVQVHVVSRRSDVPDALRERLALLPAWVALTTELRTTLRIDL